MLISWWNCLQGKESFLILSELQEWILNINLAQMTVRYTSIYLWRKMTASKGIKTRPLLMELQPQPPGNRFNPSTAVCRKRENWWTLSMIVSLTIDANIYLTAKFRLTEFSNYRQLDIFHWTILSWKPFLKFYCNCLSDGSMLPIREFALLQYPSAESIIPITCIDGTVLSALKG